MTELSKEIFEKYQVRKTHKQKSAFIKLLQERLGKDKVKVESGGIFGSRNIIIGDIDKAEYVLGAHYDTQPVMPFPNFLTPKNVFIYILYNLFIVFAMFAIIYIVGGIMFLLKADFWTVYYVCLLILIGMMLLIYAGKANKHTANDNTSGVITLIEAFHNEKLKDNMAFVLFDHEEVGMFGSMAFAGKHKKQLKNKPVINFDCVGVGDTVMVLSNKRARKLFGGKIKNAFVSDEEKEVLHETPLTAFYPSDQMNFKTAVGVATFKKKRGLGYYVDKIHTSKDTELDERNISFIISSLERLV